MASFNTDLAKLGRRALGAPRLAWHYTSATNAERIMASGEVRPFFSSGVDADDELLKLAHLQKAVYFTLNDRHEPSIVSPVGRSREEGASVMQEGGGGWYRFGYPEARLFPVGCLSLDVIPVESAVQMLNRLGQAEFIPPHLRTVAGYHQIQSDALAKLLAGNDNCRLMVRNWRVSLQAIPLTEISAIDSLGDDFATWNRIYSSEDAFEHEHG
jgi:hypothetical protein